VIACTSGPSFYIYTNDLGLCGPCFAIPQTCFACVDTSQFIYSDPSLTTLVGNGWYTNEVETGEFKRVYISGGQISGGTYSDCSVDPTPTPTVTITPTNTLTPTVTPTPSSTQLAGYKLLDESSSIIQTEGSDDINIEN